MPRKVRKKYHYLYKTTNLITKEFYIGVHSTYNLEDGYLGSGTKLWRRIQKYGRENFEKEILEFFENAELKFLKEKEIVNENFLNDPLCMNLMIGGKGGWSIDQQKKNGKKGNEKMNWLRENDKEWLENLKKSQSKGHKQSYENGREIVMPNWIGRKHSEETKKKISESRKKKNNGV